MKSRSLRVILLLFACAALSATALRGQTYSSAGAGTGPIQITTPGGTAISTTDFTVP